MPHRYKKIEWGNVCDNFFKFFCSEFIEILKCVDQYVSWNYRRLRPLFLQIFFMQFSHFFLGLSLCMVILLVLSHRPLLLFIFLHFYFLFLKLDNLNWPVFKFADSFYCMLKLAAVLLSQIYHFKYCILNSRN